MAAGAYGGQLKNEALPRLKRARTGKMNIKLIYGVLAILASCVVATIVLSASGMV